MAESETRPEYTYKPLRWFKRYPNNPRRNKKAVDAVAASIEAFKFLVPIVATSDGEIIAGDTRYLASKRLKLKQLPVVIADHLTDEEVRAFRVADNKVAEGADWDSPRLGEEMAFLADYFDMSNFGWASDEVDDLVSLYDDEKAIADAVRGESAKEPTVNKQSSSVKVSIGTYQFFVPRKQFEQWANSKKKENEYEHDKVLEWIAEQLGFTKYRRNAKSDEGKASGRRVRTRSL